MKKNIGIILAGGSGRRMGGNLPKQFLIVEGKTILEYTLTVFQEHPLIDEIAVVVHPDYADSLGKMIPLASFPKVRPVLKGGEERYLSTVAALKAYHDLDCHLLIHDAVRPLVTPRIITEVIQSLETYRAVGVGIPSTDTTVFSDSNREIIENIPDRSRLFRMQTPQGFDRYTLEEAFRKALEDPEFHTTDDCGVVKKYLPEEKIKIVPGENSNIKITLPEDIFLLRHYIQTSKNHL